MSSSGWRSKSLSNLQGGPFAFPDPTYALLRDLVVERTGVLFDENKRSTLADKLSDLVEKNGLASFLDYYYLLRYDDEAGLHWAELMNRLAVPETYFWRQAEQIVTLAQLIVPAHFAANPTRPFRIWSAACCTGEEPLSIAIALAESGLLERYPISIVGTDGSAAMVARARQGVYGERSFRQLPAALRTKYFEPDGDRWRPVEKIRCAVKWGVVNLVRPEEVRAEADVEAIFCRNAFIYFADAAIRSTVCLFSERMPPDAYLFLGASESLSRLGVDLELAEIGGAFVYVKEGRRHAVERTRSPTEAILAAGSAAP